MHMCVETCTDTETQTQTHQNNLIMVFVTANIVGCLPCTRHCAGHHTHVTSLDPPKHLPTTSEASSIVIPILQMKKVRDIEKLEVTAQVPELGS